MPRLQVRTARTRIPVRSSQVSGKKQRKTVVSALDLAWLEPTFEDTRPQPITAAIDEAASETPEFFDLRPLTSQPVAVIVRETGPASFYAGQGRRLRLAPPYREHLSQAFARFFMRVGLPGDVKLLT